jgi:alpha-tubulin suppressor-like RCC1 family protein
MSAIKTDGTLWTWGDNFNGQLGNSTALNIGDRSTPVTTFAGGTNWRQVSSGFNCTAAIKTDGTLWTWGSNNFRQIGNAATGFNDISTPVTTFAGGTNWKQVSANISHMAAIKTDGTLWLWGSTYILGNAVITGNTSTPITTFAGGTNWQQVSTGGYTTAAIKTDGTLWTWGFAAVGVLGNGITTGFISTPITTFAGGTNWKQVDCGQYHTAAIKTDETLWTWGYTDNGVLGNATGGYSGNSMISTPITTFAGGTNWEEVHATRRNTLAIRKN